MENSNLKNLKIELKNLKNSEKAKILQRFFKTGKGEYGEGDVFLGIPVPEQRILAKKYNNLLTFKDLQNLLESEIHEHRLIALIVLTERYNNLKKEFALFKKKGAKDQKEIFDFYLKNLKFINNWDLVDISAPKIVGDFVLNNKMDTLRKFAKSKNLWERRIAIVSTLTFIKRGFLDETLIISDILLNDKQDLIHKAVGWMLREVGKMDKPVLELFLRKRYQKMPRTMLRYSIEKFSEQEKKKYLKGEI